jgi:LuxR family maltose regulon positive regulatory protein
MTTPLLTTKLYISPVRPELVSRPRLIERLNQGMTRKLTLISAPAGFGKTTLLSEWIAGCGRPVAWLSLDKEDNDPARFLAYIITALQTIHRELGEAVLAGLYVSHPQPLPPESGLTILINEIAEMGEHLVLVLDDYHVIKAQAINNALTFLLDHLPPQMHLVISSRRDPALPLSRLRARGEMIEIRATDLRFAEDEAATFLNQVMGLDLSAEDVAALEARTEGWITGLRLSALSMQRTQDTTEFIQRLTGSHRYIVDYLGEEVLGQQNEKVQSFLRETSILGRLSAPLCDRITGQSGGQEILEQLETANLFIVPLDNERGWYRYHQLFTGFLQHQLKRHQPQRLFDLHSQASEWFEENGLTGEAVSHALAAGQVERAADLVGANAIDALMRGEVYTVTNWLNNLPEELVQSRPKLGIARSLQLIATGQIEEADGWLQTVEEKLGLATDDSLEKWYKDSKDHAEVNELLGAIASTRSTIGAWQGKPLRTIEISQWALKRFPEANLTYRSILEWNLAFASRIAGDPNTAEQAYLGAIQDGQTSNNHVIALNATEGLAELYSVMGQLRRAEQTFLRVFQLGKQYRTTYSVAFGAAHIGLAEVMRQWNRLDTAVEHLQHGFEICEKWGALDRVKAYVCLSRIRMAQGDFSGAMEAIQKAIDLAKDHDQRFRGGVAVATRTRLWLAQGEIEKARRWAQARSEHRTDDLSELVEIEGITLARVLLAEDKPEKALAALEKLLHNAELVGRKGSVIEILILHAVAKQAQNAPDQAMAFLGRAISLAAEEGFVQIFLEEGRAMEMLLGEAIKKDASQNRPMKTKLLAAFKGEETPSAWDPKHGAPGISMFESLSEREIEVLQLIADGYRNREIGDKLFITVGTVKRHITNIYGKLGVHSRTQAIAQARELDILE